jgi:sulfite reductase (NADPH) flavoprotein alpha-component
MTISIWRYSHLTLAISSALFIVIASLTGIILAFEPISNKIKPYASENLNTIYIAETISVLQEKYEEIITIEVDENDFVAASVIDKEGRNNTFYINPKTGEKVGDIIKKSPVFEFATNLHRSLFLKSTGRFLVGFISLLLFLIAVTGSILIVKRQGGFSKIFSKIIKEDFHQYYHVVFGRYFLIPILIITLSGVYLSLDKFSLLPKKKSTYEKLEIDETASNLKVTNFKFFSAKKINEIQNIEFPFSKDAEDYFRVKTIDNELLIHQFNGQIIKNKKQDLGTLGLYYSLIFHTGKGSVIWSLVLLLSCFAILFFIVSGFSMTVKRKKKTTSILNKTTKNNAEYIILVGSETGSTVRFAIAFKNALLKVNKTVLVAEMNNYDTYENAKNIIIFTATYGDGEAPINAYKFLKLAKAVPQTKNVKYAVVGFGSKQYPEFCKFAVQVDASLQILSNFTPEIPLFKIDNQNLNSFKSWIDQWSILNNCSLEIEENDILEASKNYQFKNIDSCKINIDNTFLITLKPKKKVRFSSGDLLSIKPTEESTRRYYSVAKIGNTILLSVKKHEFGVCSNYLYGLHKNEKISGSIQENKNFHFPKKTKEVVLVANGTGIAPFLGMIQENRKVNIHLFWGGRTKKSLEIYNKYIHTALENKTLTSFNIAYSQEQNTYVQDLLEKKTELISTILRKQGVIMICGSLNMQSGVEKVIDKIAGEQLQSNIQSLKDNEQIKTDCY